ncbi:MAG: hypothetical protein HYX68_24135 [Planctomycetes bacterium]|nr:hypothetical protein [Planctomycetota bacterium]
MTQGIAAPDPAVVDSLMQDCAATLQKVEGYTLPAAMDRRLLWLSENKESLTQTEREELHALVDFAEDRTVEKLQARVLLQRLAAARTQLFGSTP